MKYRIIKCFEGVSYLLLMFLSAAWAYFFYLIFSHKEIVCVEPNRTWLATEFSLTISVVILGLILFVKFLKQNRKGGVKWIRD